MNWLLVFVGGGLGSLARYALGFILPVINYEKGSFPWATLGANILACLILGGAAAQVQWGALPRKGQWLIMTGFCGGFSTFSTFSAEIVLLAEEGHALVAGVYMLASLAGGMAAFLLAYWLLR